jgi:peptidyl-prolyl cis-trans isomerase C
MRTHNIVLLACLTAFTQTAFAADAPAPAAAPAAAAAAAAPVAAPVAAAPAPAVAAKPANLPVAIVNGVALDAIQADFVRMDLAQRKRPASDEAVRNFLVDNELMAQEAMNRGLDKTPEIKAMMELQRKDLLANALVDDLIKRHPIADERIKAEYDQIKAKSEDTEYQPKHILVADEKLAKQIIASLGGKKPASFEDLAKKNSKDPSGKEGGDLGWLKASNVVPEFSNAMIKLKKGEVSKTPVKTQFGWHIIKMNDVRKVEFPELDKVKGRIVNQLAQQDIRKYLTELRATAKIVIPAAK